MERKGKKCKDYIFLGESMDFFPWELLSPLGGGGKGERGKGKGSQGGGEIGRLYDYFGKLMISLVEVA